MFNKTTIDYYENSKRIYENMLRQRLTTTLVVTVLLCNGVFAEDNNLPIFDDRSSVVDMWREEGIRVAQVSNGNY